MNEFIESSLYGSIATFLYVCLSRYLDEVMNDKISNIIALIVSCAFNYFLQSYVFKSHPSHAIVLKFIYVDILLIILSQFLYMYEPFHMNSTVKRVIISLLCFCVISYPLRKYYIFS
jgi:putative flippase GtrA